MRTKQSSDATQNELELTERPGRGRSQAGICDHRPGRVTGFMKAGIRPGYSLERPQAFLAFNSWKQGFVVLIGLVVISGPSVFCSSVTLLKGRAASNPYRFVQAVLWILDTTNASKEHYVGKS